MLHIKTVSYYSCSCGTEDRSLSLCLWWLGVRQAPHHDNELLSLVRWQGKAGSAWCEGHEESLTCWRLHVQILQQGGVFGDFVFLWRLFSVWVSRCVSTLRSNEAAVCYSLSWNVFGSRELTLHTGVFHGCRSPVSRGHRRGNGCGIWGSLRTNKPESRETRSKFYKISTKFPF